MSKVKKVNVKPLDRETEYQELERRIQKYANALRQYVKTGSETKGLTDMVNGYQVRKDSYLKFVCTPGEGTDNDFPIQIEQTSDKIYGVLLSAGVVESKSKNKLTKSISSILDSAIRDLVYDSSVNMLYQIFMDESAERREKSTYVKDHEKTPLLYEVTSFIQEHGGSVSCSELTKQFNLDTDAWTDVFYYNGKYIVIRADDEKAYIELTYKGDKFTDYIRTQNEMIPAEDVKYLNYMNCLSVLYAVQKACREGKPYELNIDGMSHSQKEIVTAKYKATVFNLKQSQPKTYNFQGFFIKEKNRKQRIGGKLEWQSSSVQNNWRVEEKTFSTY